MATRRWPNLTNDGKDYTFVYDVFGRLKTVKNRTTPFATVEEYDYDGLGQRTLMHADEDGDGTLESTNHDPKVWFAYADRWRIVATYRVPYSGTVDTTHKEHFVYHNAGMDGMGGSSYIDTVILRDRDDTNGWTGASDGTPERRVFYGQNQRADVSLIMTTAGRAIEQIKYSAYGVATTLTKIDYNGDTFIDPDDLSDFITTPIDWDLDGDVNSPADSDYDAYEADFFTVPSNSYDRGILSMSGIGNRIGYAGYAFDRFIGAEGRYHVGRRVYHPMSGSWMARDSVGYIDSLSLFEYAKSQPILRTDPDGSCSTCVAPVGQVAVQASVVGAVSSITASAGSGGSPCGIGSSSFGGTSSTAPIRGGSANAVSRPMAAIRTPWTPPVPTVPLGPLPVLVPPMTPVPAVPGRLPDAPSPFACTTAAAPLACCCTTTYNYVVACTATPGNSCPVGLPPAGTCLLKLDITCCGSGLGVCLPAPNNTPAGPAIIPMPTFPPGSLSFPSTCTTNWWYWV